MQDSDVNLKYTEYTHSSKMKIIVLISASLLIGGLTLAEGTVVTYLLMYDHCSSC